MTRQMRNIFKHSHNYQWRRGDGTCPTPWNNINVLCELTEGKDP